MADPTVLRRTHRAVATRRIKEVEDVLTNPDPEVVKLDQLKRGLQDTFDTLKRLDDQLIPLIDQAEVTNAIEESSKINDELFAAMGKVDRTLLTKPRTHSPASAPPTVHLPVAAKLPKLTLKHFNGSLTGTFWDSYRTAIHDNANLSNIEKFTYLQSLLEGRARDAISGLALTDANYSVAVDLLASRFGDKERAVAAHMDDLMSVDAVSSDTHLIELQRLYDKTESSIRSLNALGVRIESYGTLLTSVFVKKLPTELRLTIARKVPQSEWNMTRILEVFLEELKARERAQR